MKKWSLWRWLFHLHTHPKPAASGISRGMSAYLSTSWRRDAAFAQDFEDDPMMCDPYMGSRPTVHITRIIYTPTRPLPLVSPVDYNAPTEEVPGFGIYQDDTMHVACVDEYATQPMEMAEV